MTVEPRTSPSVRAAHWDGVYRTKQESEVSWHQDEPALSIDLIERHASRGARIIDVGGGSSLLAGRLVSRGFDVTVLDISAAAIERAKSRIGDMHHRVQWIVGDITEIRDVGAFDLWHDRAVFHFLTDPMDQRSYAALAERTVVPGGHMIIGAFGPGGPEQCSGLPVQRQDSRSLMATFGGAFTMIKTIDDTHITPWGKPQAFIFAVMQRAFSRPFDAAADGA